MKVFAAMALFVVASSARGGDFASDFALVMIDDRTEAKYGAFPFDRRLYAEAIDACARYKAKAVVLKFFLDRAKSPAGDALLCDSMKKIPVALQARLDSTEGTPQTIPSRFSLSQQKLAVAARGDRGWIPLPALMEAATTIGFVDFDGPEIPLVEEYRDAPYRSLILCCLELVVQSRVRIVGDGKIHIGSGYLPVDDKNVLSVDVSRLEPLNVISLAALLAGEVKINEIEGRVVILGWDSNGTPTLPTRNGSMRIHRVFCQCLAESYRVLKANQFPEPALRAVQ